MSSPWPGGLRNLQFSRIEDARHPDGCANSPPARKRRARGRAPPSCPDAARRTRSAAFQHPARARRGDRRLPRCAGSQRCVLSSIGLQAAAGLTDIAVASLRQLTTALRPPILDHLGLLPAIRWEASIFSKRTGIRCHVRARPASIAFERRADHRALPDPARGARQRREARRRRARSGSTSTRQRGVTLMEIRDNGRGITDAQINDPRTMGLLGMRERALALGGECGSRAAAAAARGCW